MLDACRRTIVAGRQDALISDYDRPDLAAQTCGALGYHIGEFHKISIPGWTGRTGRHRVITQTVPFPFN